MIRQRTLASMVTAPALAPYAQLKLSQNIAELESRAATIGCRAAFSSAPSSVVIEKKPDTSLSFDECFKKCKQVTKRTNEQCFDACSGR